jgi:hypothetical protein
VARGTDLKTNFSAGELSPLLDVRQDIAKYGNGANQLRNALVIPHGGATKRAGTRFVQEVKNSSFASLLIPFQYNVEQTYMVEISSIAIRFHKDQGVITHTPVAITGATAANPVVITAPNHGFLNTDFVKIAGVAGMTQLNGRGYVIGSVTTHTFALTGVNGTAYTAYTSGGTASEPVEIAHNWAEADVPNLSFAQTANTLYIAHPDYPTYLLTRTSHTAWTLNIINSNRGPFRAINTGVASMKIGGGSDDGFGGRSVGATGLTLTASASVFTADHVGAVFRLWEPGQGTGVMTPTPGVPFANGSKYTVAGNVYGASNATWGASASGYSPNDPAGPVANTWLSQWSLPTHRDATVRVQDDDGSDYHDSTYLHDGSCIVQVTAYFSGTTVHVTVIQNNVPHTIIDGVGTTTFWEEGAWSTERGYPRCLTFQRGRLWAASTETDQHTIWASRINSFENFEDGPDDDHGISAQMASDRVEIVRWMAPGRALLLGTAGGEHAIAASSQNEAVTPSNIQVVPQSPYGSSPLRPLRVGDTVIFGQRNGDPDNPARRLREARYSADTDKFASPDLTIISEHITGTGITSMAYTSGPVPVIWCVRSDGLVAACTYEDEQQVKGWSLHTLGGEFGAGAAVVERCAVIPGADGDELWLVVKRTISGATVRHIEVMTTGLRLEDEKEDAIYLDSALTYDGASTTTLTQLWHLEGEEVYALVNGSKQGPFTVATGRITLSSAGTLAHVGLAYETVIETLDLAALAQAGTPKSRAKRISQVWPSVYRSLGGTIGPDSTIQHAIIYRTNEDVFGASPALKTGTIEFDFPGGWDRAARVRFEHDEPYPFTVLGVAIEGNVSG